MKRHLLPCSLLCMLLAATTALGGPGDTFYEANLSLTRAARLEKEGDYKAALESGKKAAELLQSLKSSTPEWNPEWVAGKLDAAAQLQQRVEPLAQKAGESKKADYSLKPGERRDFTLQRAYKAHEQQKLIVGAVPARPRSRCGTREICRSRSFRPHGNPRCHASRGQTDGCFQKIRAFSRPASPHGPGRKVPHRELI